MVIKVISFLILFYIVIFEFFAIASGNTTRNISTNRNIFKLLHILAFISVLAVIGGVSVSYNSYHKNYYKTGEIGDVGMEGPQGDPGSGGKCNYKCGQKLCYSYLIEAMEDEMKKNVKNKTQVEFTEDIEPDENSEYYPAVLTSDIRGSKINLQYIKKNEDLEKYEVPIKQIKVKLKNTEFLNKINKICHSKSYQEIIRKNKKNKPTEDKMINFLTDKAREWIRLILSLQKPKNNIGKKLEWVNHDYKKGWKYLTSMELTSDYWSPSDENIYDTPFKELEKYDMWNWHKNDTILKKIVKKNNSISQLEHYPNSDDPKIYIKRTNHYKYLYDATTKPDTFGPECEEGQIGVKRDNPDGNKYCIVENRNQIKYLEIYKFEDYGSPEGLSLYHPIKKIFNGITFYPVGSVWRGRNDKNQPDNFEKINHGEEISSTEPMGPVKDTILVAGDTVNPQAYIKMWHNKDGCNDCQDPDKTVIIWKPIPPEGYVCLGDVATSGDIDLVNDINGNLVPRSDYIKCVPIDCAELVNVANPDGDVVWSSEQMKKTIFNENGNVVNEFLTTPLRIFNSGSRNAMEERNNRTGLYFEDDGGHNLFHTVSSFNSKPITKALKLNPNCLYTPIPKSLYKEYFDKGLAIQGEYKGQEKYSIFTEFGRPPVGIITNTDMSFSLNEKEMPEGQSGIPEYKAKSFYVQDANSDIEEYRKNGYFIMTYNKDKNDFSNCLFIETSKDINGDETVKLVSKEMKISYKNDTRYLYKIVKLTEYNKPILNNELRAYVKLKSYYQGAKNDTIYFFKQYYDERGVSNIELVIDNNSIEDYTAQSPTQTDLMSNDTWLFSSIVGTLLPSN